jgi:hypothetical protein
VVLLGAHKTRHEESNYRAYQFAGAAHIRDVDAAEFGLADPELANPADWVPLSGRSSSPATSGAMEFSRPPASGSARRTMRRLRATPMATPWSVLSAGSS